MTSFPKCFTVRDDALGLSGWLVVDSMRDGLSFGGTRFSSEVTADEVAELARCMTWKLAVHGLPVGGAKAGLRCDPSDPRLPELIDAFGHALREPLTQSVVLGKDLGATNEMLDSLYGAVGVPQMQIVSGSSVPARLRELTGYRRHMTGLGIAWATQAHIGDDLSGKRVAIQGFGAVGAGAAVRLEECGARVVAVSDVTGTVARSAGFGSAELLAARRVDGRIERTSLGTHLALGRDALFAVEAELLVLAATSHSVTKAHAETVAARLVVEGANFGLTLPARDVLYERGVVVIPDILANSSSAAMVAHQMATGNRMTEEELWGRIERAIREAVCSSMDRVERTGGTLRRAWISSLSPDGLSRESTGGRFILD